VCAQAADTFFILVYAGCIFGRQSAGERDGETAVE